MGIVEVLSTNCKESVRHEEVNQYTFDFDSMKVLRNGKYHGEILHYNKKYKYTDIEVRLESENRFLHGQLVTYTIFNEKLGI